MTNAKTNANSFLTADMLANARLGTFTGLVITKRGALRGKGADRKRYGDDMVHVCLFTGFRYPGLVQRSLDALMALSDADVLAAAMAKGVKAWHGRGAKATSAELTLDDMAVARAELVASFQATLAGTNSSTTDQVFEPLVVDGEPVRGCRVYKGQTPEAEAAGAKPPATPGTVYLQGLRVSSRVLVEAVNGPLPKAQSAAKTVAKKLLTRQLPVSNYVSYRLQPGDDWLLRAGGAAAAAASKDGMDFSRVGELVRRLA